MVAESILPAPGTGMTALLPGLIRMQVLADDADLLLGQLRLHANRIHAMAASFRRETERLPLGVGSELTRLDGRLDGIAERVGSALSTLDRAFAAIVSDTAGLEQPDGAPPAYAITRIERGLAALRQQHEDARMALRLVVEGLMVCANKLTIIIGQPGSLALDQLRVIVRQMRSMARITAALSTRLDVSVQNQCAILQELLANAGGQVSTDGDPDRGGEALLWP